MHWISVSDFLSMGGYAFYVWTAFGFSFALLFIELILLSKDVSSSKS
jgi:heme exporter protein D